MSTFWIRNSALVAVFAGGLAGASIVSPCPAQDETQRGQRPQFESYGDVERQAPELDEVLAPETSMQKLAEGFEWSEGPVWVPAERGLLFSDIPNNRIVKWTPRAGISVYLEPSGYTGEAPFTGGEPGTNGLMLDADGRLLMCCHGDRALKMRTADGQTVVLADRYDGKRLNSPNDLVVHPNGDIYFTDPPYGLPKQYDDPGRELDWCGVYRLHDGEVTLLTKEMTRPNGIAFSPDYKTLYVAQSDPAAAIWKAFPVLEDGTLGESRVLFDATEYVGKEPGLPDGMAVDREGNLWATGPGGVWVFSPEGKVLGRLMTGQATANCTFGPNGWLYITADMYLLRIKTKTQGLVDYPRPRRGDRVQGR